MPTKPPDTRASKPSFNERANGSTDSNRNPLGELRSLLDESWADEDSRVSVTVMTAPTLPAKTPTSSIPPAKVAKKVATIVASIIAGLIAAWTALHEAGILP